MGNGPSKTVGGEGTSSPSVVAQSSPAQTTRRRDPGRRASAQQQQQQHHHHHQSAASVPVTGSHSQWGVNRQQAQPSPDALQPPATSNVTNLHVNSAHQPPSPSQVPSHQLQTALPPSRTPSSRQPQSHPQRSPSGAESPSSSPTHRPPRVPARMGNTPSIPLPQRDRHESSEPTPISVPRHTSSNAGGHSHSQPRPAGDSIHQRQHQQYSHTLPNTEYAPPLSGPNAEYSYAAQSNLHFPPRLPLPIEEEDYVPGSPIISPDEVQESLLPYDLDPENPNRGSILSSTTLDDDEVEEYPSYSGRKTVPTVFKWEEGGERVYVTGTFTEWTKKYRMMKNPETGIFTVTIDLPPGTHHARFLVDGEMQLSEGLPTAVDFNGILINYFEVNADDIVVEQAIADQAGESQVAPDPEGEESTAPPGVDAKDHEPAAVPGPSEDQRKEKEKEKAASPEEKDVYYGNVIPEYLLDLDRDENTNRYRRAAGAVDDLQNPPSLPLFLGKSILNGSSSVKDDASVLTIPNHTVLNHLSTSSIRNDILATAVTTRYKQKFLTTITYRPTSLE